MTVLYIIIQKEQKKMKDKNILLVAVNAKYIHSNLAIYSLKAYSKNKGIDVHTSEYTINQKVGDVLSDIYKQQADVLCLSCYIWNIEFIKELITEYHKLCPDVPIWLGGPEVSYDSIDFLKKYPMVTGIMIGEGEDTFCRVSIFYCCRNDSDKLYEMDGIAWRDEHGELHINEKTKLLSMDELPFCYEDIENFSNRIIYYETSRGCPFSCSYCLSSVEKKVRFRSLSLVFEELQFFIDHRVKQVKFVDRTFNCSHEHAISIWRYIHEHDNGVTNFHFEVSADLLNDEEIELLNKMRPGLVQLEIGVQTTNEKTISEIRRSMNLDKLKDNYFRIHNAHNVHQHLDLIAGLPYEDYESFAKSFDEIYRLGCEQLQLGFLKVLKGSHMHHMAEEYELLYQDKPPYEVMATKWLSYDEMIEIKKVEEMLEIHYNSGQFLTFLKVLSRHFDSPFKMYLELADWYKKNGYVNSVYSRVKRTEIVYEFALSVCESDRQLYEEALVHDLYVRERSKARPYFANKRHADTGIKLKELGCDHRYCHIEPYYYDVLNGTPEFFEDSKWVLYDYEHKKVYYIEQKEENEYEK